jgi:hypothetical protein
MKKTGAKTGRKAVGEVVKASCAGSCLQGQGKGEAQYWRQKYEALRDRMLEVGFTAFDMLDDKQKYRLVVMQYLRDSHGELKISTESLHTLKPEVKREAMDFLYAVLRGNLRRKDIVHEVFREPRKGRLDCFADYGNKAR